MSMPRERKYLLLAGAILLFLGVIYRFYPSVADFFAGAEDMELKARQVTRYQQTAGERQRLQTRQAALAGQLERAQQILLSAPTEALAAVDIQNAINDIAYSNGLVVESVRVQKPKDGPVEGFIEVPVTVTIKVRIRQMIDLLHKIESAPQFLAVTDMNVRVLKSGDGDSFNAVITVAGYMKKPEAEAASPSRRRAVTKNQRLENRLPT